MRPRLYVLDFQFKALVLGGMRNYAQRAESWHFLPSPTLVDVHLTPFYAALYIFVTLRHVFFGFGCSLFRSVRKFPASPLDNPRETRIEMRSEIFRRWDVLVLISLAISVHFGGDNWNPLGYQRK